MTTGHAEQSTTADLLAKSRQDRERLAATTARSVELSREIQDQLSRTTR